MSDTFTEDDLAPGPEERRARIRGIVERVAATVAILAVGLYVGGLVALGACAAPMVFRMTPAPMSGTAMGAAFARFDQIALGAAVVALGCEVARTWAAGRRGLSIAARVRRLFAIGMAASSAYVGLALTPRINELHRAGIERDNSPQGAVLEATHRRAELFGKVGIAFGIGLVALHVFTLRTARPEDDDEFEDDDAPAPLPPGPRDV
jgi:hypothetical protein